MLTSGARIGLISCPPHLSYLLTGLPGALRSAQTHCWPANYLSTCLLGDQAGIKMMETSAEEPRDRRSLCPGRRKEAGFWCGTLLGLPGRPLGIEALLFTEQWSWTQQSLFRQEEEAESWCAVDYEWVHMRKTMLPRGHQAAHTAQPARGTQSQHICTHSHMLTSLPVPISFPWDSQTLGQRQPLHQPRRVTSTESMPQPSLPRA